MKALWKGKVVAESNQTIVIEGNHYFPPGTVNKALLEHSDLTTICHWKGEAHYYNIIVDSEKNENAAWYYPEPLEGASIIKDFVAFWKGVRVE